MAHEHTDGRVEAMRAFRRPAPPTGLRTDESGSVFVEAALVLPILCVILAGMVEWGLTLYQYNVLSTANSSAVRQLIINRGFPNPYSNVMNEFDTWAKTLGVTTNDVKVEIQDSTNAFKTCASDSDCTTLLDAATGKSARVTVTYTCTMNFTPSSASPCPITISTTGLVE